MGIAGKIVLLTVLVSVSLFAPGIAFCLDEQRQMEFDRIFKLNIADLTREAALLLNKKYPDEDWNAYRFPSFVFTSEPVEVGYKIAAKEPQSLGGTEIAVKEQRLPCYCSCEAFGHKSLLHCFWQAGKVGGEIRRPRCRLCYLLWAGDARFSMEKSRGKRRGYNQGYGEEVRSSAEAE